MVTELRPFQGEEHRPFQWNGGAPAALLVHGFPGTPAELRPLAGTLHRQGWTVQGLLLPGFGQEIEALGAQNNTVWVAAVRAALEALGKRHAPLLLIGYSMGAALAMQAVKEMSPTGTGLVMLAPFRQLGTWWQQLIGIVLSPFFRQVRPFQKSDFSDPETRQNIAKFLGDVDLDDPAVQQALRELTLPARIFGELHQAGRLGYHSAQDINIPSLIIQGTNDGIVSPKHTRGLLQRLPGPLNYVEVVAEHDLLNPDKVAWPQVEQAVLTFAQQMFSGR